MSDQKVLWLDLETTGFNEWENAIVQLSCIMEFEGKEIDRLNIYIKPFKGAMVSKSALEVTGFTMDELRNDPKFIPYDEAFGVFINFLDKHIDRFDWNQKLILGGKNIGFDIRFLREFFIRNDDEYYGSWFLYPHIDVETSIAETILLEDFRLMDYKLETICDAFGIELKPHDSMSDIIATRKLYWEIKGVTCE